MRLGLAGVSAAAVFGGFFLVNSITVRPAEPRRRTTSSTPWAEPARPAPSEPRADETRSYELIRYLTPDGAVGMVDDVTRVPAGAKILGRERKTVVVSKPAPPPDPGFAAEVEEEQRLERMLEERQESSRRLAEIQRRVMGAVLGGRLGDAQADLDAMQREAERMNDCADGDCAERALEPEAPLRSPVPRS